MTMRFPGRAVLPAAAVLASIAITVPASASTAGLSRLDITGVYVTGVSSGGFMATQLQVAYSGTFDGAGIIAAGPYDCGQGNVINFATCDIGASLPTLEQLSYAACDSVAGKRCTPPVASVTAETPTPVP